MISKFRIITIGKKNQELFAHAINEYSNRIKFDSALEWTILPHDESNNLSQNVEKESKAIISSIKDNEYVILLDNSGKDYSTEQMASVIGDLNGSLVFIIGGAYGVNQELKQKADMIWKFGNITLPHQLCRLVLVEQIYRVIKINSGHPYHHS